MKTLNSLMLKKRWRWLYWRVKPFAISFLLGLEWLVLGLCLLLGVVTFYLFLFVFPLSLLLYVAGKRQGYWLSLKDFVCLKWQIET